MDEHKYWLAFSLTPGIGHKRLVRLYQWFGNLEDAWKASIAELQASGLEEQPAKSVIEHRAKINPDREIDKVRSASVQLLVFTDAGYPSLLRELDDPPAVLYVKGNLKPEDNLALTVVGTRKATKYGRDAAYDLSKQLARHGITIISGLAQGIDSAAHLGAVQAGGRTIAVLGCGVDIIYPRENTELARKILNYGAIISEFSLGTQPIAANFPRRNRILSGLALGVLVIEAPEHSGALITANLAAEQGREVFAVPSNIFNTVGRGTNRLIQDGAKLVIDVADILEELNIAHQNIQVREQTNEVVPANGTEAIILQQLQSDPIHIDELVRLAGLPIQEVTSTLTILELKGLAQMVGHMQYSLVV